MDMIKVKKLMEENNKYIKETFCVKEIGIFGSFVKGTQKYNSDIDILVTFEKGHKDFFNYMRLKYWLERLLDRSVDLVIKEAVKPRLRDKILNEGVHV